MGNAQNDDKDLLGWVDTPCPFVLPDGVKAGTDVSCGQVITAVDETKTQLGKARVSFFRVPGKTSTRSPVVLHFGGPGDPGSTPLKAALSLRETLGTDRDVIAFGQRGTEYSTPFPSCGTVADGITDNTKLAQATETCRKQTTDAGFDPQSFSTAHAVRDVEAMRVALGYPKISLYGVSYGTAFVLEYMRQFPDHTDSAVIDSVKPPNHGRDEYWIDCAVEAHSFLDYYGKHCTEDARCSATFEGQSPDLAGDFASLLAKAHEAPIRIGNDGAPWPAFALSINMARDQIGTVVTRPALAAIVHALANPSGEVDSAGVDQALTASLNRAIAAIKAKDADAAVPSAEGYIQALKTGPNVSLGELVYINGCVEGIHPTKAGTEAKLAEVPYATMPTGIRDACTEYAAQGQAKCGPFEEDFQAVQATFNQAVTSSIPTLVMASSYDPQTPKKYAQLAQATLSNSRFIEVPCTGHGIINNGISKGGAFLTCAASALRSAYDGQLDKVDLACLCSQ